MEKNKRKCIRMLYLNHYDAEQKLTQHCKSTILQFEKDSFHLILMMLK